MRDLELFTYWEVHAFFHNHRLGILSKMGIDKEGCVVNGTVVLEIGLTDTLFVTLPWPHRQAFSADTILSGPHWIEGHRKMHLV